ncbi:hypothetical protein O3M35_002932 [Rhynocoris fuscipes]|uniref:F-ATPase gamma subunit n=1 Tax=Rhynocoris fuscipes TaxID=488301 RepID=A0AAW1CNN7_9HEMI
MVSAAKYSRAERELRAVRPIGDGAKSFYERAEVSPPSEKPDKLIVAVTSDRGLCGAVHTQVARQIRAEIAADPERTRVICIGDKSRAILQRLFGKNIIQSAVAAAPKLSVYDSLDSEVIQSYMEFSTAALLFYALKEGACSEQSSRMTAMDNASKNAGEMIDKLTLTFNRTRQAVITRELIEIISGAAALD